MVHRSLFAVTTALLAGLAAAFTGGVPADAAVPDPFTVGYVWADQPTLAGCYAPVSTYSYNSTAATNSICRTGRGSYVVHFPGLAAPGGNAQVTAYGSTPASCKVVYWVPSGSVEQVGVACFNFSGIATDATFTASFTAGGGSANTIAFAWADNPTATSYTASSTYQYNNRGGLATITHAAGTGAYTISFPDNFGAAAAGGVKVTAYGAGSGVCKALSWGPNSTATAELVNVQCYNSAGSPSEERFSVVYVNGMNILGDNLLADGYAWADQPSAASYTPNLLYQRSTTISHSGTITINSPAVGTYDVFLPYQNQGLDGGHAQVTAYGAGTSRCQIGYWLPDPGGRTVRVYCFANGGALVDTYFALQYTGKIQ
nr:hypothetical protein [uncultured bacterium]